MQNRSKKKGDKYVLDVDEEDDQDEGDENKVGEENGKQDANDVN